LKAKAANLDSAVARPAGPLAKQKRLSLRPHGTSLRLMAELASCELEPIAGLNQAVPSIPTVACRPHRKSVSFTHKLCMTTARRRARATLAFFSPRRCATRIAHALSVDQLLVLVSITLAAS
jgi:hypothetical protein